MKLKDTTTQAAVAIAKIALRALDQKQREQFFELSKRLYDTYSDIKNSSADPEIIKLQYALDNGLITDPKIIKKSKDKLVRLQQSALSSASVSKAGHQMTMLACIASAVHATLSLE